MAEQHEPGFSGNDQTSGIVGVLKDESGATLGFHVDSSFVERYDSLIRDYSKCFSPPLKPRAGIVEYRGKFAIDAEHMVKYLDMNDWRNMRWMPETGVVDKVKKAIGL